MNNYSLMKKKDKRLEAIRNLLQKEQIGSQEELLLKLKARGFEITQATLSRDLKDMKVVKAPGGDGMYIYSFSKNNNISEKQTVFPVSGFLSIDFSGNLAVMKTIPGFANGIASVIDKSAPNCLLGTIAGDDTVLIIIRENCSKNNVLSELSKFIPGII